MARPVACQTVDELKYKLVRFSADSVDLSIAEKLTLLRLQCCPLRFSTCNLHGPHSKEGITATVNDVRLQQYCSSNMDLNRPDNGPAHHPDKWVESGMVRLGPVYIEGSLSGHSVLSKEAQLKQHVFLQKHDRKTHRLWFLWPKSVTNISQRVAGNCGCIGGCNFFGANSNGLSFFNPTSRDLPNRHNIAIPCLGDRTHNPGYCQSIIKDSFLNIQSNEKFYCEVILPAKWPNLCHEPSKLPYCPPDYRTHKSSSSCETPNHLAGTVGNRKTLRQSYSRQRSVSGTTAAVNTSPSSVSLQQQHHNKQPKRSFSRQRSEDVGGNSTAGTGASASYSWQMSNSESGGVREGGELYKASSLLEVQSTVGSEDESKYTLARTESLVSDVLSFYDALDGEEGEAEPSKPASRYDKL